MAPLPARATDTLFADLPDDDAAAATAALAATEGETGPLERLDAVIAAAPSYVLEDGPVRVVTDRRWFAARAAGGAGGSFVELRRWPGDSVLALYAVAGDAAANRPPVVAGVTWTPREGAAASDSAPLAWSGTLATATGERPIRAAARRIPGAGHHLVGLFVPGDAGLGLASLPDRTAELLAVWRRLEVDAGRFAALPPGAAGAPLALPELGVAPAKRSEDGDPWQVVQGGGFSMSLPPGVAVRLTVDGVMPPTSVPGQLAWFRGRYTDVDDRDVVLGDGRRAGYLALVRDDVGAWFGSPGAPLGAPGAERRAAERFALAAERTGAEEARVERWSEAGLAGEWLVVRLRFESSGLEFGMPVLDGETSASLYWIPVTWRGPGRAVAPPPRDPMERFGITFSRLRPAERKNDPWTEGILEAPGLVARLPRDYAPAASLRTGDGYPIRFVDGGGDELGTLTRRVAGTLGVPGEGWAERRRQGGRRAVATWQHRDGRVAIVAREGHAFVFAPAPGLTAAGVEAWERLLDGVQLTKAP